MVVATARAASLRMCAARLTAILPLGWLQPARPTALTDAAMSDLLCTCKGIFPFAHEATAGDYTAMDLGRLAWMLALLLGKVMAAPLGTLSFKTVMRMKGAATKRAWKQMGIDARTVRSLEWRLRDAVAGAATRAVANAIMGASRIEHSLGAGGRPHL